MAKDQLKIYTPIVWVEVLKTFLDDNHRTIYDKEYLLWDGELKDFADRKANATDIFFPRYDRFVVVGKIQDFWLHKVQEEKVEEEEAKVPATELTKFKKRIIYNRNKISEIVTGSMTKLLYKKNILPWIQIELKEMLITLEKEEKERRKQEELKKEQ